MFLICWNCGSKNTENDNFCLECGKLLNSLTSDEQVDLNYKRVINITRKGRFSEEFIVTENNQTKFKIRSKSSIDRNEIYISFLYVLMFVVSFSIFVLDGIFIELDLFLIGQFLTSPNFFYFFMVIIMTVVSCGTFVLFIKSIYLPSDLIENERIYIGIDNFEQGQTIGKVKYTDIRHNKWIFTINNDCKVIKKNKMKFTKKTNGVIQLEAKNQNNHNYHFTRSEKGSTPVILRI